MNKKVLLTIAIFVIIIVGYWIIVSQQKKQVITQPVTTNITIKEPFNHSSFFIGEISLDKTSSFTNPVNKSIVSFNLLTDTAHQAINPSYDLLVNGKSIGEVGGQGIALVSFSPDGKYFAFRSRSSSGCVGMCQDINLYVVNLVTSNIILTNTPSLKETSRTGYDNISEFIESYRWDNDTIDVTSFIVGLTQGNYYQISPKKTWSYNVIDKKYTLVQTLPEAI